MVLIKRFNFGFINVPKNASTAIRSFMINNVVQPEDKYSKSERFVKKWQNMDPALAWNSHMDVQFAIDNKIAEPTVNFHGVVRHPLEKLLSLYAHRYRTKEFKVFSVENFRERAKDGVIKTKPWQEQLQSTFLTYNGKEIGTWWLYDHIDTHISDFVKQYDIKVIKPLQRENNSFQQQETKFFINKFYDNKTIAAVEKHYEKDFELYERVKKQYGKI